MLTNSMVVGCLFVMILYYWYVFYWVLLFYDVVAHSQLGYVSIKKEASNDYLSNPYVVIMSTRRSGISTFEVVRQQRLRVWFD